MVAVGETAHALSISIRSHGGLLTLLPLRRLFAGFFRFGVGVVVVAVVAADVAFFP